MKRSSMRLMLAGTLLAYKVLPCNINERTQKDYVIRRGEEIVNRFLLHIYFFWN